MAIHYNITDSNGKNLTREDIKILADQIIRFLLSSAGLQSPAGTPLEGNPPL